MGSAHDDVLNGTDAPDRIRGGSGKDRIHALGGDDDIEPGEGDDGPDYVEARGRERWVQCCSEGVEPGSGSNRRPTATRSSGYDS